MRAVLSEEQPASAIEKANAPAGAKADHTERSKTLKNTYIRSDEDASRRWCRGFKTESANLVIDKMVVQYFMKSFYRVYLNLFSYILYAYKTDREERGSGPGP